MSNSGYRRGPVWLMAAAALLVVTASAALAVGTVSGTVTATGGPATGLSVQLIGSDGKMASNAIVAADGTYSITASAGTYTAQVVGTLLDSPDADASKSVTLQDGQTATLSFAVKVLPTLSLNTADLPAGAPKWKLGTELDPADTSAASPTFDDSAWIDVDVPGNIQGQMPQYSYYAYRIKFDVPDDWVGKSLIMDRLDVDDGDTGVYLNGTNVGPAVEPIGGNPTPWSQPHTYLLPGSIVKKTNVLAIFAYQGYGGAGMTANGPRLYPAWATKGIITGKVTDLAGNPAYANLIILDSSGAQLGATISSGPSAGKYIFAGYKPGTYTVKVVGNLVDSPEADTTKPVTVTAGAVTTQDFAVTVLPTMSLASASLPSGAPGWKLGTDLTPGDFSAASPTFDDSAFLDVTVPGNADDVAQNSDFVYRLKFDVPDAWVGKNLILDNFSIDDGDTGVFFNGTPLGAYAEPTGGPASPWGIIRTYAIPGSAVKKTNVLAIFAHQGGGGVGMTGNAPRLYPMWTTKGTVVGTIVGADGKPIFGSVSLLDSTGKLAASATSSGPMYGQYIMAGLTPGAYKFDQWALTYAGAPSVVNVEAGKILTLSPVTPTVPPFFEDSVKRPMDDDFSGTTLDPKWQVADVGDATGGDQYLADGLLNVTAGGHDIWDQNDGFHYIYQTISGDFTATLQVVAIPDNRDWELGGLMIRKDLDQQSPHAFIQVSPRHDIQDKLRPTRGSFSNDNPEPIASTGNSILPNAWLKLKRQGTRVAYYWTTDPTGSDVHFGSVRDVPGLAGDPVLVGIAATSHSATDIDDGFKFDNFRVIPAAPPVTVVKGDLNGNGKVDIADATLALQIAVGLRQPSADQLKAGDLNGDGRVAINEVTLILKAAVGLGSL